MPTTMGRRMFRWFVFSVVFALFPLIIGMLFRDLLGRPATEDLSKSPEVLFFSLMISATALGDLGEVIFEIGKWDWLLGGLTALLFVGSVFSAILYGAFLFDSIRDVDREFRAGLLGYSIVLALGMFVAGTTTEVMLARLIVKR